jgi:hypothetical protein
MKVLDLIYTNMVRWEQMSTNHQSMQPHGRPLSVVQDTKRLSKAKLIYLQAKIMKARLDSGPFKLRRATFYAQNAAGFHSTLRSPEGILGFLYPARRYNRLT